MLKMAHVMQQAQKMQKKFKETQSELENVEVVSIAGNGAVTAILNGQGKFKGIKLTPQAINPENPASVDADTVCPGANAAPWIENDLKDYINSLHP